MNQKFNKILEDLLKQDERFYFAKEKILKRNSIVEHAYKLDEKLISLLLGNEETEEKFFKTYKKDKQKNNKEITIFDKEKFAFYINHHSFLPDSYTAFKSKIGLSIDEKKIVGKKKLLKNNDDISLIFPYKDCILQGGQTKEEDKRNEIFYNEILAPDEIDRLKEEKVLKNFKRFNEAGEQKLTELKKDKYGNIKDNLIIKGNNFLALHSLKRQFAGKVKLIYIDPPYNTGNDGFKYNDNFNHSSWLVFMKNRLEVAKELLRDDGVIFVQCDDNEQAYLKVLMDEVFGRENFVSNSAVVINRGGKDYGGIAKTHEYILIFSKNKNIELNQIEEKDKKFQFNDKLGGFNLMELRNRNILFNDKNRPNLCYPFYVNPLNKDESNLLEISLEKKEGYIEVMPLKSQGIQTVWRWGKEKVTKNLNIEIKAKKKQDGSYMIVQKYRKLTKRQRSVWDDKEFVNERGTEHIKKIFGNKIFSYPKSEFFLQRILEISTQKGDIVLDYHLGSGTTAAVAHKMERQYIGIEQMDYIEGIAVERLKKVIGKKEQKDGELVESNQYDEGGISKAVNWQGGGEFVYCELAEYNQKFVNQIEQAKDSKELINLLEDIKKNGFLSYQFKEKEFRKNIEDFENLSLNQQKKIMMELLDKNMLYLNYGDIGDSRYGVGEDIVKLNEEFYGETKK